MAARNIDKILLYHSGLVTCLDHMDRQSPSLQGFFNDVHEKLGKMFKPDDVKWFVVDGIAKEVSYVEWAKKGGEITKAGVVVETRPVTPEMIGQMRAKSLIKPPQSDTSRPAHP